MYKIILSNERKYVSYFIMPKCIVGWTDFTSRSNKNKPLIDSQDYQKDILKNVRNCNPKYQGR